MNITLYEQSKQENIRKYGDQKKNAPGWQSALKDGIVIMDPDGWDRENFTASWKEEITLTEFYRRREMSTTIEDLYFLFDEKKVDTL